MKFLLAAILTAGLALFAPDARALTLDDVEGLWRIDYETTLAETDDTFFKEAMSDEENRPESFTVTFDKAAMSVTVRIDGPDQQENLVFTLPDEAAATLIPDNCLVLVTEKNFALYIENVPGGIRIGETKDLGKTVKDVLFFKR